MAAGYLPLVEKYLRDTPLKTILIMDDTIHYGNYQQIIFDYRPGFIKALKYLQEQQFKQCFVGGMQNLVTSDDSAGLHAMDACKYRAGKVHPS